MGFRFFNTLHHITSYTLLFPLTLKKPHAINRKSIIDGLLAHLSLIYEWTSLK